MSAYRLTLRLPAAFHASSLFRRAENMNSYTSYLYSSCYPEDVLIKLTLMFFFIFPFQDDSIQQQRLPGS